MLNERLENKGDGEGTLPTRVSSLGFLDITQITDIMKNIVK